MLRFLQLVRSLLLVAIAPSALAGGNVDLPRYPSISPDGSSIVFSWRGDLWSVQSSGGRAIRLTAHPASDLRSAFSPDGSRIAFESDRSGDRNLLIMNVDGTGVRQVTRLDRSLSLTGFGVHNTGDEVVFCEGSIEGDVYRAPRPYMIAVEGGEIRRVHDAFGGEHVSSPDGGTIAFTRGGSSWSRRGYRGSDNRNVWLFSRATGSFTQLTDWNGNDGKPKWGSDRTLYYLSDRELDRVNLYRMSAEEGDSVSARATSFEDRDIWDYDVSADGTTAVIAAWDTLYTLDLRNQNSQPVPIEITAGEDESDNFQLLDIARRATEAALSPDGKVMALVAYGEVYVRNVEAGSPTRRVTDTHAREREVAWSPDGLTLYYVSDANGDEDIFAATVAQTRTELKDAFVKATTPASTPDVPTPVEPTDEPAKEAAPGEPAAGLPPQNEPGATQEPPIAPAPETDADSTEDEPKEKEKDDPASRWHDAVTFGIQPVIVNPNTPDTSPRPSPDGKFLSFRRGRGDIVILDLSTSESRTLIPGWDFSIDWRWSPDSCHIAYSQDDQNFNADIWIIRADGSAPPANISRHPDSDYNPRWSSDGKILAFVSERVGEELDVWTVHLERDLDALAAIDREKYYKDAAEAAKKRKPLASRKAEPEPAGTDVSVDNPDPPKAAATPVKSEPPAFDDADLVDAYLRLRRVTRLLGNEGSVEITAAGDRFIFSASGDEAGLYSVKWDGTDQKKIAGSGTVQHLTLTGDKVVIVDAGRASIAPVGGGAAENVDIQDRIRVDLQLQAEQKFREAARILGEIFYHPTMKGLDWSGLTARYLPLARQSRTADEFNYVAAYLVGELNGSHLGVRSPDAPSPNREASGRLGVRVERTETGFRVTEVIPRSPAAEGPMALKPGDIITGVEFGPIGDLDTMESLLVGRTGLETAIDIARTSETGETLALRVLLTPVSASAETDLLYDAWWRRNAALVHEWSGGRIGYLHIRGMNEPSLNDFERDLFAAAEKRDGLLIDVRNNGGGSTADLVLSSIMVTPHAYAVPRGGDPTITDSYPQDRLYIQRYIRPVNMLCNEKSFSNAEIISHAFKTLKRGTLVGQQTYGGVISTGGTALIDGTFVRLPFRGWFLPDGTDMENHGAMPDLLVPQTPEDEAAEHDAQLKAAVEDLMKRVG